MKFFREQTKSCCLGFISRDDYSISFHVSLTRLPKKRNTFYTCSEQLLMLSPQGRLEMFARLTAANRSRQHPPSRATLWRLQGRSVPLLFRFNLALPREGEKKKKKTSNAGDAKNESATRGGLFLFYFITLKAPRSEGKTLLGLNFLLTTSLPQRCDETSGNSSSL